MFTVCIAGRPNVGKTTLFNKICKKKEGIVSDFSGLTIDRREKKINYHNMSIKITDTPGIESLSVNDITNVTFRKKIQDQVNDGLNLANIILFVIDGRVGVQPEDIRIFNTIRKKNINTLVIINKCESKNMIYNDMQLLGNPNSISISAEHNINLHLIIPFIKENYLEYLSHNNAKHYLQDKKDRIENKIIGKDIPLNIAIVGRPNAGKSTLINQLISQNRLVTDHIAGTTRDSVYIEYKYKDKIINIIDTAGIRKKISISNKIEKYSVDESFEAIKFCHIAILTMDITNAFEAQDLAIARRIIEEGRILILLFNKCDLIPKDIVEDLIKNINQKLETTIQEIKNIIFFTCSALFDKNLSQIIEESFILYNKWDYKITTSKLNNFLLKIKDTTPIIKNRRLKLKYIKQIKTKPPTFLIFANIGQEELQQTYISYLRNRIIAEFSLENIPIRLIIKRYEK